MSQAARRLEHPEEGGMQILGRGLHARKGVHLTLRALREAAGKTQMEIAEASGIDQADISRLEARQSLEGCQLATLGRYLDALGARLELTATFGDKRFLLAGTNAEPKPRQSLSST